MLDSLGGRIVLDVAAGNVVDVDGNAAKVVHSFVSRTDGGGRGAESDDAISLVNTHRYKLTLSFTGSCPCFPDEFVYCGTHARSARLISKI
jgi:hypothetical protein